MKLATIEKISEVITHPNADKLTIFKLEGMAWRVISGEKFNVGDRVIYIKTDTVVPDRPEFEFLRKNKFRVNCIRLRGEYSNGLILPPDIFEGLEKCEVGEDVADRIGVTKYEKPVSYQSGDAAGSFPTHILSKTDEERIENHPEIIEKFRGKEVYISVKHDGSSVSVINHPDEGFMVCSRNLQIKESKDSKYWQPVFKYNLRDKIPVGYGIQFELIGHGIQKNPEQLKDVDMSTFNVWRIGDRKLLDYQEFVDFCTNAGIPTVKPYYVGEFKWDTVEDMIEEAKLATYPNGAAAEGLVWRLVKNEWDDTIQKDLSVQTINYNYKD